MDKFKEKQLQDIVGKCGIKCKFCNWSFGKSKKRLNRMARARLKSDMIKLNY